jgi:hypothetical protein
LIPKHIKCESDDLGRIYTNYKNISDIFIYNARTYEKITPKSIDLENGEMVIDQPYCDVEIDFNYLYQDNVVTCVIGRKLIEGYLLLEGKSRVKDDTTGKVRTAILRIPRLKLVSDLSMRLGREAAPVLANFNAIGLPAGGRGDKTIMELVFLNDDIDAEI